MADKTKPILTNEQAVRQLTNMRARVAQMPEAVRRKRSIRESERAMWLADIAYDLASLDMALAALGAEGQANG